MPQTFDMKTSTTMLILLAAFCGILTGCDRASPEEKAWRDETFYAPEKMEALLVAGLDPNLESGGTGYQDFILNRAVKYRRLETVRVLLKHGSDPNKTTWGYSKTPLFQSAHDGTMEIAKLLLDSGADVNAVDDSGNNALREAALSNEVEMVTFLLDRGIDALQTNKDGQTMLSIATKHAKPRIVSLIAERVEQGAAGQPATRPLSK